VDSPKPAVPGALWEGRGLAQKWLPAIFNRLFLGQVEFGCKFKVDRAKEGDYWDAGVASAVEDPVDEYFRVS
jgi:hypothetical protein